MGIEISARAYSRTVKAMFAIGCFAGLLKVLAGSISLLTADLILFALVFIFHPRPEAGAASKDGIVIRMALFLAAALIGLGFCQSFNPNVPSPSTGLFYFRISTYPFMCVFIGYKLMRIPSEVPGIYRFILGICTPICAVYALVQSFQLDPLSIKMVKHLGWGQFGSLGSYRVVGFLQGPVQLGLLSAMGAAYFLAKNIFLDRFRLSSSLILLLLSVSLVASMSRASLLGFLTFVLLISMLCLPRLRRKARLASFAIHFAFLSVIPATAIALVGDLETVELLASRLETLGNLGQDNSFQEGRIINWKNKVIPALLENPLGRGNGSTGTSRLVEDEGYSERIMETESLYFALAMELGWFGLASAAPLFLMAIAGAFLVLKNGSPSPGPEVAAVIWVFAFAGITSPNMSAFPVTWLFFVSVPIALAPLELKVAELAWTYPHKEMTV